MMDDQRIFNQLVILNSQLNVIARCLSTDMRPAQREAIYDIKVYEDKLLNNIIGKNESTTL